MVNPRYTFHVYVGVLVLSAALFISCSSSHQAQEAKPIHDYEKDFNPSSYDETKSGDNQTPAHSHELLPDTEKREEYVTIERVKQTMGYRVQVFSTTSFEDAKSRKDEYNQLIQDSSAINIVFDAPYYKIRIGDFLQKPEAEMECQRLKELGLQEAWIVRDKVNYIITEKVLKH